MAYRHRYALEKFSRAATRRPYARSSLRLHYGLEDAGDLMEDLEKGFARLNAVGWAYPRSARLLVVRTSAEYHPCSMNLWRSHGDSNTEQASF